MSIFFITTIDYSMLPRCTKTAKVIIVYKFHSNDIKLLQVSFQVKNSMDMLFPEFESRKIITWTKTFELLIFDIIKNKNEDDII